MLRKKQKQKKTKQSGMREEWMDPLGLVEVVKKASKETGINWGQSKEHPWIQAEEDSNRKNGIKKGQKEPLYRNNKQVSLAETKDSQREEVRVKSEDWIRARLQRNLTTTPRSLNFTLHVISSVLQVFMLWCEDVRVLKCARPYLPKPKQSTNIPNKTPHQWEKPMFKAQV